MSDTDVKPTPHVDFETHPDDYKHWKLSFDGPVARLSMDVQESDGLRDDYELKLNSYDLAVDIELADAIERIRFEHPEVRSVVVDSLKDRIFCAGANIFMLGSSSHGFKVNFCKFTNETRLGIEDASDASGIRFLAALNGICAGGGYELALACDEIHLVDDGSSAVSLPETPLLGVLPGTGGLTRVVDKRKVRRDLADVFGTLIEGVRGERAVQWNLVDAVHPTSKFDDAIAARAAELADESPRKAEGDGVALDALEPDVTDDVIEYRHVKGVIDRDDRRCDLTVRGPEDVPADLDAIRAAGADWWALRAFRELDDALLRLRLNEPEIGLVVVRTEGDHDKVRATDALLDEHQDDWFVAEVRHKIKRVLKRMDVTARTFYALVEPGSCFDGTLLELALASDRTYMLDHMDEDNTVSVTAMNAGPYPMGNGLTRLQTRFLGDPGRVERIFDHDGPFEAREAEEIGLTTWSPDDLDWEDEIRIALEERASLSPDALTGMEANLRFAGPETLETKIFGRLTAWQNWIFQRPNAVGETGALTLYGQSGERPDFDWRRT